MADLLQGLVAPDRVMLDTDSGDTLQTVRAAAALVRAQGYAECIACTDPYHQPRARMLFALQGVRCRPMPFSDRGPSAMRRRMWWREAAAFPYDLIAGIGAAWQDRRGASRADAGGGSLVELGRYSRIEAHIVVGRLDSEGIPAVAFDGNASIVEGSWLLIPVRVMVDADDLHRARLVLATPA